MKVKSRPIIVTVLLLFLLTACGRATKLLQLIVTPEDAPETILKADKPRPLSLNKLEFFVVNEKNLNDFLTKMRKRQGEVVFMAFTPKTYENLSLNTKELQRYIRDQKTVIVFYEKTLFPKKEKEEKK